MKYSILLLCFMAISSCIKSQHKNPLAVFPLEKLDSIPSNDNPKIVVFMPSLYLDCEYASMLTNSLNRYYKQGLTFENEEIKPSFDIILVVNDSNKWEIPNKNAFFQPINKNLIDGLTVIYDVEGKYYQRLDVEEFATEVDSTPPRPFYIHKTRNHSSTLFLLDKDNTILYKDENYRSQGEHLKPLDNLIKQKICDNYASVKTDYPILKIGDNAPDFLLSGPEFNLKNQKNLYDDTQNIKVITFYPAVFSGVIEQNINERMAAISCAVQIRHLDKTPLFQNVKRYAISNATNSLLKEWKALLGTRSIKYLNDVDNAIAGKYNSLHPDGYNKRYTYIIDKNNKIRYINEDFKAEDDAIINAKIAELLKTE